MRTLVLGGGSFVGPAVIDAAVARGDDVVVLNRGQSCPPPAGIRHVVADRTVAGCFEVLAHEHFDVVVDTWSHAPRVVNAAAAFFATRAERYAYVSSISVYKGPYDEDFDERAPVVAAERDADATDYPADKRGAELAVEHAFGPERCVLARAGLIVGPKENTGRLLWWLRRTSQGGDVLAPGPPEAHVQWIDARDLAAFLLSDTARGGAMSVTSPRDHSTMGAVLDACVAVTSAGTNLVWATPAQLAANDVSGWTELPLWLPPDEPLHAILTADVTRARTAGLWCRDAAATVVDTWTWLRDTADVALPPGTGLDPKKEHDVLRALGDGAS